MDDSVVTSVNAMSPCLHVSRSRCTTQAHAKAIPKTTETTNIFFLYFFSTSKKKKMPPADYNSQRSGP